MKVAILGTRGIPNFHGGFEQFAEYLSQHLVNKGHSVTVYSSHTHPFQEAMWKGVMIRHTKDPEKAIGTAGQFIYDLNSIWDCRKQKFDLILQLGYTSSAIWGFLLPKGAVIVTNMDGLEWKRSKYSIPVRKFLKYSEMLAVRASDFLVADSIGIQDYLKKQYQTDSTYIAYGAVLFQDPAETILELYDITPYSYNMLVARLEPENNIETILDGVLNSAATNEFLVIGKHETRYGQYLRNKYQHNTKIRFLGGIYNLNHLNNLRYFSNVYFHGHSVGGTNPSLLEAMGSYSLIAAHDNIFNKSVLGQDAFYFSNWKDVVSCLNLSKSDYQPFLKNNADKIKHEFEWEKINSQYETFMLNCLRALEKGESKTNVT